MALNAGTSPANYAAVPISEGGASRGATPRASDTASEEEFSKETFASLKKYVLEGDINLKTTGLVAGAGIMVCGFVSCMAHIFDLDIPNAMLDVLMFCIGYVCSALEYKEAMLRIHFNDLADYVQSELHIMVTPYGRSIIYLITGLVLLTEGSWFQSILGIIILALGGFIFNSMRKSVDKLYKMKIQLASEGQLKTIFDKYASDSSGELDTTQVARLCVDLGAGLTYEELVAAIEVLDKSNRKKIGFEEFQLWYSMNKV